MKSPVFWGFIIAHLFAHSVIAQSKDGLVNLNGTQLYLHSVGQGEPIVVIHGGPGMNHSYFIPHLNTLSKNHQVIYFDQRSSGRSAISPGNEISLDTFAEDIEAIRKYLGKEKIYLFAHSWGAIPATNYSIKYPERIKGLILCNSVPLNKEFDEEMWQSQLDKMVPGDSTDRSIILGSANFKAGKPSAYKKLLLLSFRNSFHKPHHFKKLQFEMPDNYKEASGTLFAGLGKELSQFDYYKYLRDVQFPILVLHGVSDAIPIKSSEKIIVSTPSAQLTLFKKSGHFIFMEEQRKFNAVVNKFIK